MVQTAAIVTTLKNPGVVLDFFIRYHLTIGFKHIFLFFDDPQDAAIADTQKFNQEDVTIILNDSKLQYKWQQTSTYKWNRDVRKFLDSEVKARQMLNVEIAIELAQEKTINWLLHIDIDELFYLANQTLSDHFQELVNQNIYGVTYLNYEAFTESPDVSDFFAEVTLFKNNPRTLTYQQKNILRSLPQFKDKYFFFYSNGKSAARIHKGLLPRGVHTFKFYLLPFLPRTIVFKNMDKAAILHYPCCGFSNFWLKYKTRGLFADKWWGKVDIAKRLPTHLKSRNIVMKGDEEAARKFYEKTFIPDKYTISFLMKNDLCCRIDKPSLLLNNREFVTDNY